MEPTSDPQDGKLQLRFATTNRGKLDFLRIVVASAIADGIVESIATCEHIELNWKKILAAAALLHISCLRKCVTWSCLRYKRTPSQRSAQQKRRLPFNSLVETWLFRTADKMAGVTTCNTLGP